MWQKIKDFFSKSSNVSFTLAAFWLPAVVVGLIYGNPITTVLGIAFLGMNLYTGFVNRGTEKLRAKLDQRLDDLVKSFKVPPDAQ